MIMIVRLLMGFSLLLGMTWTAGAAPPDLVDRIQSVRNPNGIQLGFWCNYNKMPDVLRDFGKRPIDRVNFTKWVMLEKEKGVYDWGTQFDNIELSHRCGSTVVANLNVIFSKEVNPKSTHAIPKFYPPRISHPETRAAARKLVDAYTRELLRRVGDVILVFDYELMWHYLPKTPEIRTEYRDWFVEACEVARAAAADVGKSDQLRLACIVNGNPLSGASKTIGGENPPNHVPQQWLLDVVAACDVVGVDSYAHDAKDPTSPETTFNILAFWRKHYAQGKPMIMTENGISSVLEALPDYPKGGHHARGTEAQQAAYYADFFRALKSENSPGGRLGGQLRGYCVWMYHDQKSLLKTDAKEWYFGLRRLDGSKKPSFDAVKGGFGRIEKDLDVIPWTMGEEVRSEDDLAGDGISTVYRSGTDFEFLRCVWVKTPYGRKHTLEIEMEQPGDVIAHVNGAHWLTTADREKEPSTRARLDVTGMVNTRRAGTIDLWFTGPAFPVEQVVKRIELVAE